MDTFELLDELLKKSSEEIDVAVLQLMLKGKLDSHRVMDLYMKAIEIKAQDLKDRLTESNTSILELIHWLSFPKSKKKSTVAGANAAIHRGLYNLNQSKQFNMAHMNEKFNYNEDEDRKLSWYWREKRLEYEND